MEIAKAIRKAAEELGTSPLLPPSAPAMLSSSVPPADITPDTLSSNLRIKKEFSDREKYLFLQEGFLSTLPDSSGDP